MSTHGLSGDNTYSLVVSNFTEVARNWDVWSMCLAPIESNSTILLTKASQSLFRPDQEDVQDLPSPMTVDDEDTETREEEIEINETAGRSTAHTQLPVQSLMIAGLDLVEDCLGINPVPRSPEDAFAWTEKQRLDAERAVEKDTLEDIQDMVRFSQMAVGVCVV